MSSMPEKKPPGFMLYDEISLALLAFTKDDLGEVTQAVIRYKLFSEEQPDLSDGLVFAFRLLQGTIDRDNEKYKKKCEQNAVNRKKGNEN